MEAYSEHGHDTASSWSSVDYGNSYAGSLAVVYNDFRRFCEVAASSWSALLSILDLFRIRDLHVYSEICVEALQRVHDARFWGVVRLFKYSESTLEPRPLAPLFDERCQR